MFDLLQFAAMLALPALLLGGLIWLLMYSSVRLALRHEVSRLERRRARTARAEARAQPAAHRPRLVRTQPASVHPSAPPRTQPAPRRQVAASRPAAVAAQGRAAS